MATTDTTVSNLIINKLTKEQYDAIASPSATELYLVPDEIDSSPTSGSSNPVTSGGVYTALSNKQDTLVSGTNIKTINNTSLLGSGNISISGGGGGEENVIEIVKVNGTALTPDSNKAVDVPVPTESTVSGWGFTKNTGTYSKPSGGIPATDLASAVQTSLGLADTALQSYTETDPTVPSWAKASSKPTYTASEVGALPDTTVIPTESTVSGWGFTKNAGTITGVTGSNGLTGSGTSGSVTISHAAPSTAPTKTTSAVYPIKIDQYGHITAAGSAVTIPTVPTNVSAFTNDANYVSSDNTVAIYSGSSAPSSSTGKNGDIYIQTS